MFIHAFILSLVQEGLDTANNNMAVISAYLDRVAGENGYAQETKGLFASISDSIKTNVDNVIAAMAEQKEKASGTQDVKTGGLQQPDVKKADDALPGMAMPERKKELNDSSGRVANTAAAGIFKGQDTQGMLGTFGDSAPKAVDPLSTAKKYIKSHANKAGKAKKEYSDVNQKIYENKAKAYSGSGKILSSDELKELAKKLGVTYDNAKKSGNLYKKLKSIKFPGFKKGGIAKLVKEKGEDGFTLARNGEGFIAPEHVEPVQKLVDSVPEINKLVEMKQDEPDNDGGIKIGDAILTPVKSDLFEKFNNQFPDMMDSISPVNKIAELVNPLENLGAVTATNNMNSNININMGGITMNGVNDPAEFADQMVRSFQKYPKVQKAVHAIESDRIAGGGRLGVQRIRRS